MTAGALTSIEELDRALAAATPSLTLDEQRLAVAIYGLLALGQPVNVEAAAARAELSAADAAQIVRSWPAVFMDKVDRIVGFWGLALDEMPHRLYRRGVDLYAWCAWDPLFLGRILGQLEVATNDPITGETISYRTGTDGEISDLSHADSVLSFVRPDQTWDDRVMETFCHYVLQFASPTTAETWTKNHPGTFVIELDDAKELGRRYAGRIVVQERGGRSSAHSD